MEPYGDPPETLAAPRHKCAACFKQYKKMAHLIEHMKSSYHSVHQPKCGVCQKYCKSFESLREHITGPIPKANCSQIFAERGCSFCLEIFDSPDFLNEHKELCCLPAPGPLGTFTIPGTVSEIEISSSNNGNYFGRCEAIAIDCEMVGGGSDGSLDLCARVCLVDEDEKLIFHTYVLPQTPVTNYRFEVTGLTEEHLRDGMPLNEVQDLILKILYNGDSIGRLPLNGGKAKLLVGHSLEHDLDCLRINYPDHMLRDTSKYRPLMKTNHKSHSLKYLTQTYLGYVIQSGIHDPYEDCVSAMRLCKRMRSRCHQVDGIGKPVAARHTQSSIESWKSQGPTTSWKSQGPTDSWKPQGSTDPCKPQGATDPWNPQRSNDSWDSWKPQGSSDSWQPQAPTDSWKSQAPTDTWEPQGSTDSWKPQGSTDSWKSQASTDSCEPQGSTDAWKSQGSADSWKSQASTDSWKSGSTDLWKSQGSTDLWKFQGFTTAFDSWKPKELESMTPEELLEISKPDYRCWCLDAKQELQT